MLLLTGLNNSPIFLNLREITFGGFHWFRLAPGTYFTAAFVMSACFVGVVRVVNYVESADGDVIVSGSLFS